MIPLQTLSSPDSEETDEGELDTAPLMEKSKSVELEQEQVSARKQRRNERRKKKQEKKQAQRKAAEEEEEAKDYAEFGTGFRYELEARDPYKATRQKRAWFTGAVVLVDLAVMAAEIGVNGGFSESESGWIGLGGVSADTLLLMGAKYSPLIRSGTGFWRLFTPLFLHIGLLHLAVNLFVLLAMGVVLERNWGSGRFALLFLLAGLGGNLLSAIFLPDTVQVGASGSLFGLTAIPFIELGLYAPVIRKARRWLILLSLINILTFLVGLFPGFDNFAHLGGMLGGVAAGMMFFPPVHPLNPASVRRLNVACRGSAVIVLVGFFTTAFTALYGYPEVDLLCGQPCMYLNCLPVSDWCETSGYRSS